MVDLPSRSPRPTWAHGSLAGTWLVVAWTWASPALGDCHVDLRGGGVDWQAATRALSSSGLALADCASIVLVVDRRGARLTFVTRDGRRAERPLQHPDELSSTVAALAVVGPSEVPACASAPPPGAHHGGKQVVATNAPQRKVAAAITLASPLELIFGLGAGARGGAHGLWSPVMSGLTALVLHRWEVGVTAAFDVRYTDLRRPVQPAWSSGAMVLGVGVGRRESLTGDLWWLVGARLALAALTEGAQKEIETSAGEGQDEVRRHIGLFEGRVDGYLGLVAPVSTGLRLRAELTMGLVGIGRRIEQRGTAGALVDLHITPTWAVGLWLGLEVRGS